MPFEKGKPKTGGRAEGTPNKITRAFKHAVMNVFEKGGGEKWLLRWAKRNQTEFFKIAARLIPTEVTGTLQHAVATEDQKALFEVLGKEGLRQLAAIITERTRQFDAGAGTNGAGGKESSRVH